MSIASTPPELDALVEEIAELRPLPAVAARALQLAEGDRFSAHELAGAVAADPALTARVLRLANSAYYGFPRRIATVRDAVVLLGFPAVRSATLAASVIQAMPDARGVNAADFWRHSITVGLLAEVLARARRRHVDEAFTAGVLHNAGRLALAQQRPEALAQARMAARRNGVTIEQAQRELLGFTDAKLGGALAIRRSFPAELAEAVRLHQLDPNALPDPESLSAFVVRARLYARACGVHDSVDIPASGVTAPEEWSLPPVSTALEQQGGIDGVGERVSAFVETARGG